jgi:hypothetical protein
MFSYPVKIMVRMSDGMKGLVVGLNGRRGVGRILTFEEV